MSNQRWKLKTKIEGNRKKLEGGDIVDVVVREENASVVLSEFEKNVKK